MNRDRGSARVSRRLALNVLALALVLGFAALGRWQLGREQIKPAPELNSSVDSSYITGIGTIKTGSGETEAERMLILMDIEALMSSADMGLMEETAEAA